MTSGYVDYVIGNTEFNNALCTRTRSGSWSPTSCCGTRPRGLSCMSPARTGTTRTPTTCCWARRWRRQRARTCRSCCPTRCCGHSGLTNTANSFTPEIPAPVLHAFTSERREALEIPAAHRFTRSRRTGTRRGRSPTAPSRRPTSTTWRPARGSRFGQAAVEGVLQEDGRPPTCAARPARCPAAPPAPR